jgi:uncharacterized protein
MKVVSITFFYLFFYSTGIPAQTVADYHPYKKMSRLELQKYRQSIWDTLPAAVGWVNDFEGLYDAIQENKLESMLQHLEKRTSIEICIVTIDSNMVAEQKFNDFAYRLLKKWGIGKISKSNGIVICISKDYKKLFVCTDFGINKYMDYDEKYRIINKYFIPFFVKNDYYQGTLNGLNAIIKRIDKRWKHYN